jgi:hypothetical protein
MTDPSETEIQEPGQIRFLRRLVTTLTVVMIAGLVTVITLLVIRLSSDPQAPSLALPDSLDLPDGVAAEAVTFGDGWIAVVSGSEILVFDSADGNLRQTITLD